MTGSIKDLFLQKKIPNFITIFGEESYFIYDASKLIQKRLFELYPDLHFESYDLEELKSKKEFVDILERIQTPSFFSQHKLIVFKNIEKIFDKRKKEKLEIHELIFKKILEAPPVDFFFLILTFDENLKGFSKKIQKEKSAFETLKFPFNILLKQHYWIEFTKINENQINVWLRQRIKSLGFSIEDDVLDFFLANTNPNLWEINNEIEKLVTYLGDQKHISSSDLKSVLSGSKEINIFELTTLVAGKNYSEAIAFLERVLNFGKHELLLLSILFKFFKNLLIITEVKKNTSERGELSKAIGINPFFLDDYLLGLRNYSKDEIENALIEIVKVDQIFKTSSLDSKYLFFNLLSSVMFQKPSN